MVLTKCCWFYIFRLNKTVKNNMGLNGWALSFLLDKLQFIILNKTRLSRLSIVLFFECGVRLLSILTHQLNWVVCILLIHKT